jgi:hypothetical protein
LRRKLASRSAPALRTTSSWAILSSAIAVLLRRRRSLRQRREDASMAGSSVGMFLPLHRL